MASTVLGIIFGVATALVAIIFTYIKWTFQYWKRRGVPYLEPSIPFGNMQNPFKKTLSDASQVAELYQQARRKRLKYCGVYFINRPSFLVVDLDLLKCVLAKDFQHFVDRGLYTNEKDDPISANLFTVGGLRWKNLRVKFAPTFTSAKLRWMFETVAATGLILERHLDENITSNEAVDVKDLLARLTADNIGSCAFGIECNSLKEPSSPFRMYGARFFMMTKLEALRFVFSQNFPNLARKLRLLVLPKDVASFFYSLVEEMVTKREKDNVVRKDFLQLLIEMKKENDSSIPGDVKSLTMGEMAAQCFVFFAGGFETSSTAMAFALFELATHPEVQDKVRDEIKAVLAKHDNKITYDSLNELKYQKQVIDETLRKYPPGPLITRVCIEDYKIPDEDVVIEKGTFILVPIEGIHYDEEFYPNPKEFDPDRFSEENIRTRHSYSHIPFGEGPRICIGARFAILQTKVGLTTILKNYRVKLHEKTEIPLKMSTFSIVPSVVGDIWLTFEKI